MDCFLLDDKTMREFIHLFLIDWNKIVAKTEEKKKICVQTPNVDYFYLKSEKKTRCIKIMVTKCICACFRRLKKQQIFVLQFETTGKYQVTFLPSKLFHLL